MDGTKRRLKPSYNLVDLFFGYDEWRREHDQVAVNPIGVPRVRPHHQSGVERGLRELLREFLRPRERLPRCRVLDELDAGQQSPAAHVTHGRMRSQDA